MMSLEAKLWIDCCNDIYNGYAVGDTESNKVALEAAKIWLESRGFTMEHKDLLRCVLKMSSLIREGYLGLGQFGTPPDGIQLLPIEKPTQFLAEQAALIRALTPDQLEKACAIAGYDVQVVDVLSHHPLYNFK